MNTRDEVYILTQVVQHKHKGTTDASHGVGEAEGLSMSGVLNRGHE